jgi:hypothetical protein
MVARLDSDQLCLTDNVHKSHTRAEMSSMLIAPKHKIDKARP